MKLTKKLLENILDEVLLEITSGETSQTSNGDEAGDEQSQKETDLETRVSDQVDVVKDSEITVNQNSDAFEAEVQAKEAKAEEIENHQEDEPEREASETLLWTQYGTPRTEGFKDAFGKQVPKWSKNTVDVKMTFSSAFKTPSSDSEGIRAQSDLDKYIIDLVQKQSQTNSSPGSLQSAASSIKNKNIQQQKALEANMKNFNEIKAAFGRDKKFSKFNTLMSDASTILEKNVLFRKNLDTDISKAIDIFDATPKTNKLGDANSLALVTSAGQFNSLTTGFSAKVKVTGRNGFLSLMTTAEKQAITKLQSVAINNFTKNTYTLSPNFINDFNRLTANGMSELPWASVRSWEQKLERDDTVKDNPEWETWNNQLSTLQSEMDAIDPSQKERDLQDSRDTLGKDKNNLERYKRELRDAKAEREERTTKRKRPPVGGYYTSSSKGGAKGRGGSRGRGGKASSAKAKSTGKKGKGKGKGKKGSKDKKEESLFFKDNRDLIGENKMAKLKDLLSEVFDERPQIDKHKVIKGVSEYGKVGKSLYGTNIVEVAKKLSKIAESAHSHILSETDEWFDKVSVNKNMKSLKTSVSEFKKAALESNALNQRLTALYEDIGHVLNRYYEINEEIDDVDDEEAGMDYKDLPDKDLDNDGDEDDSDEYLHHKLSATNKHSK